MVNYPNAHRAPRSALPEVCSHADDTCYGRLECEPQRVRGYKAACQRWNINRGKPCTCGQHEEAK